MAGPETPKLMVDVVILSEKMVVIVRRGSEPYQGQWAVREVAEETGLGVEISRLVGVYSEPDRDPRCHNVNISFLARVLTGQLRAASDAADVDVLDSGSVELEFDQDLIISDAMG